MLRRTFLAAGMSLFTAVSAPTVHAATAADPAAFISNLGKQAFEVIGSSATLDQKVGYFREMLRTDFDLAEISRFVLGSYWRVASAAQREEFQRLFEDHLLRSYGMRLAQYGASGFRVTGNRSDPADLIVTSQITRPQGAPIEVDWRLGISDGFYKIRDVAIEGVSMAISYRSDFAAQIQRNGGEVEGLLAMLRGETANLAYGSSTGSRFPPSSAGS